MGELNGQDAGTKRYILFTPEEREKCRQRYIKFAEKESKIEKILRRERALASAKPPVYLTC